MWIDTWEGSESESCPRGSLGHLYGAFLLGFLWPIIDLPGSKSVFGISRDFPRCACTSLSQDGFYGRGLWVDLVTWHHSPLDLQGAFLPMCSRRGLLTSKNEEYVVSYLLSGQGPASSLNCPVILVSEYGSTGTNSNHLPWEPIYLLTQ